MRPEEGKMKKATKGSFRIKPFDRSTEIRPFCIGIKVSEGIELRLSATLHSETVLHLAGPELNDLLDEVINYILVRASEITEERQESKWRVQ
jgi:hypothetical protein